MYCVCAVNHRLYVQFAPEGEAFRDLVCLLSSISTATDDDMAFNLRRFGARPKYVLRKLAFSLLPEGTEKRDIFVQTELCLTNVCTQQRKCVKEDLFAILNAICDRRTDLAKIPLTFCHKEA